MAARAAKPNTTAERAGTALAGTLENLCCEAYNRMDEDVTFTSTHPQREQMRFFGFGPEHWNVIVCKPGEWVFLPHGQYIQSTRSGRPVQLVLNLGDQMGKGNKLPSRPDRPKIQSFMGGRRGGH